MADLDQGLRKTPSYKVVLLGDASVGKSSMVSRFARNLFSENIDTTIGAAFTPCVLDLDDGRHVRLEIWDTAGQERFASLAPMYYRNAAAAIVVFDQSCPSSFDRAQYWVAQLRRSAPASIVVALAANKCDLPTKPADLKMAKEFAEEQNLLFFETSARTGHNVRALFLTLANKIRTATGPQGRRPGTIVLSEHDAAETPKPTSTTSSWCCGS